MSRASSPDIQVGRPEPDTQPQKRMLTPSLAEIVLADWNPVAPDRGEAPSSRER